MSHDIIATHKKTGEKISSIKIGSWNQCKSWILYESLNCLPLNSGVSGNGEYRILTPDELKTALSKFYYLIGEPESEIVFTVSSSPPYKTASSILKRVLSSVGGKPRTEDIKTRLDSKSTADVERFLKDIQVEEEIMINFL